MLLNIIPFSFLIADEETDEYARMRGQYLFDDEGDKEYEIPGNTTQRYFHILTFYICKV